jgi:hypothetical protein
MAIAAWLYLMALLSNWMRGVVQTTARSLWIYRAPHRVLLDAAPLIHIRWIFSLCPTWPRPTRFFPLPLWSYICRAAGSLGRRGARARAKSACVWLSPTPHRSLSQQELGGTSQPTIKESSDGMWRHTSALEMSVSRLNLTDSTAF